MKRVLTVLSLGVVFLFAVTATVDAGVFVATAKNFRGALYQGFGPTPSHASEMAIVKCSQDSFLPPTCRVICVRMEVPPQVIAPKVRKPIKRYRKSSRNTMRPYPANYSWGMQRP